MSQYLHKGTHYMIKNILNKIWNFLLAISEARAESIRLKQQYRGY
jgi:hypothetical protein